MVYLKFKQYYLVEKNKTFEHKLKVGKNDILISG